MITEELPLVWRINGTNLRLLTQDVRTNLTTMQTRRSSVLRILATEVTNNSNIECGVILQHSQVVEYSCPVPLLVQGNDLTIIIISFSLVANLKLNFAILCVIRSSIATCECDSYVY